MKIFNTLSRQVEELIPREGNKINFFVCGPTVYDYSHLGHAKAYIQFDFISKYLRYKGYDLFHLQNITDIDDKIINRSSQMGINWEELADAQTENYLEDMRALNITSVDKYARATDYIPAIVKQVKTLIDKGFAYTNSDGIYFEISKFPKYGKLSGRNEVEEFDGVSRIDSSTEKRGWNDFCLWKFYKEGEPFWETKLGKGRPGWHIEDTAITETLFGPQYDIHGGGADIMFPHHEAEITQMESASGKSPLVKYWMHVGLLNVDSKKMGKSLGNFMTIRDALKVTDYRTLRYFFISTHYHSSQSFTKESLEAAKSAVKRIDEFMFKIDINREDEQEHKVVEELRLKVTDALDNDFNTPKAMGYIFDFIKEMNQSGKAGKATFNYLNELDGFFGFLNVKRHIGDSEIEEFIKLREDYRKNGDYKKADEIRIKLEQQNIQIYDSNNGTNWRVK